MKAFRTNVSPSGTRLTNDMVRIPNRSPCALSAGLWLGEGFVALHLFLPSDHVMTALAETPGRQRSNLLSGRGVLAGHKGKGVLVLLGLFL